MAQRNLYILWLKYVGVPALIIFIFGLISAPLRDALFSEEVAQEVLLQAIPFVAIFVTIILLFMLTIAFVAIRLQRRISNRTHKAIELTLVASILISLFSMFQSINIVGYNYGFLYLLVSLLSFILWTHVTPRSRAVDNDLQPFTRRESTIGLVGGAIAAILMLAILTSTAQPIEPYGMRQRQWDTFDEDRQAEVRDQALAEFQSVQIPYLILIALIPGAIAFFAVREVAASRADTE